MEIVADYVEFGRKGGKSKSLKKLAAAKRNGFKKGNKLAAKKELSPTPENTDSLES